MLTDPDARLPDFERDLNAFIARALNASIGHREEFWSNQGYNAVALLTPEDAVDKAAYALANPVAAGLVRSARSWPGLWSGPETIGDAPIEVPRPRGFFDPEGQLPESAVLELTAPPGFESARLFRQALSSALAVREAEAARSRVSFLGVLKVLAQRPTDRPGSREPGRQLRPRVASRDPGLRVDALGRLAAFASEYRQALETWLAGRYAIFPEGTYLMRVLHGAPCAASG